jgi:hypothetical protein
MCQWGAGLHLCANENKSQHAMLLLPLLTTFPNMWGTKHHWLSDVHQHHQTAT